MNTNGIADLTFRFMDSEGKQREATSDAIYHAWCDALDILRLHDLDRELPRRTLEAMGHTPRP